MLSDLSFTHILIIMLIVLLVFGAKRLPELGSSMGKGIREFKKSMREVQESIDAPDPASPPTRRLDSVATRDATVSSDGEPKKLSQ
jgi:sec-independent protein translocase protein TatA